ncbi:MAG: von Willebrand factor type A domain-containing protein [Oscillospiraceae bacterium]
MKLKKKIIPFILALSMMGLTACGGSSDEKALYSSPNNNVGMADYEYYSNDANSDSYDDVAEYDGASANTYQQNSNDIKTNGNFEEPTSENYAYIQENGFKSAKSEPLSTFSADVDTASYTNIRRLINDGYQVPENAVRIEEMLNYFNYDYPQPTEDIPFSSTVEISNCPWNENNKLMLVGLNTASMDTEEIPPSNIVFLLDVSGSMSDYDKLPLIQEAFTMLAENLRPCDRISIVTYAGQDEVILSGGDGNDIQKVKNAINNLVASGSTNGSSGIITAYELADKYLIEDGNNRVILATDGDLNVGITNEDELQSLIETEREKGIYLSVLGVGSGNLNDSLMETLADNGNGNYSYIDNINEAKKVLLDEMSSTLYTIAKDVKFQIEFNPKYVDTYRLIGYDNRVLSSEDFNNDSKDAGEIGAGHTVTALYEVSLNSIPDDTLGSTSNDWATLNIRYKNPNEDESNLIQSGINEGFYSETPQNNLKFASAVAEFGMLLKNSEHMGSSTYEDVISRLNEIPNLKDDTLKSELLDLVSAYKYLLDTNSANEYYY